MSINRNRRDSDYRTPFSHSFKGTLGKYTYIVSCEGALIRSDELGDNRKKVSINLGGLRSGAPSDSDIAIEISPLANRILIRVPLTAVAGIYSETGPDELKLTTDPRLLYSPGMQIDERGLYSLLQFGAYAPPLTLWRQIARLIPGKFYTISGDDLGITCTTPAIINSSRDPTDATLSADRQCEEIAAELDRTLRKLCPDRRPIILFSGGVDSGLLAARAAAMRWRQTLLVNCQMGPADSESVHAEAMARWLGLSFERISYSTDKLEEYLSRLGATYPVPFADISAFPTFQLAEEVIKRHEDYRVVLDGTGADGAFGLLGEAIWWRRVSRLPKLAGKLSGFIYRASKMWMRRDSRIGRLLRILYSLAQMPGAQAGIAQNPLCDIAYHIPDAIRSETQELLDGLVEGCVPWAKNVSPHRLSMVDLIIVCCGVFAQKDKAIFDASPMEVRYPFLESNMVRLALERAIYWPGAEQRKLPLKNLLVQQVPREMVFRPKSGFRPPIKQLIESQAFLKAFDQTVESASSISPILDRDCIRSLHRCLEQGENLPLRTYYFIWAATFVGLWLDQICNGKSS
jgi:asparagine synthase (glutamine-hydrolysing)